jgi:hypothetical protein
MTGLLGPAEIRELAARLGAAPTKKLGQNFVHDPNTVRRIVAAAGLTPEDVQSSLVNFIVAGYLSTTFRDAIAFAMLIVILLVLLLTGNLR